LLLALHCLPQLAYLRRCTWTHEGKELPVAPAPLAAAAQKPLAAAAQAPGT
jgi:hypothetical protein